MDPALDNVIQQKIEMTMSQSQNKLLQDLETMMSSKLEKYHSKMVAEQKDLSDSQISKIQEINADKYVFKKKGNEEQYKHNSKVVCTLREAEHSLDEPTGDSVQRAKEKITEGISLINHRQKLIKLADSSDLGWRVVNEYTQHQLASDSEDEKKIYKAEARAARKMRQNQQKRGKRFNPYGAPTKSTESGTSAVQSANTTKRPGACFLCGSFGHWRNECPTLLKKIPVVTGGQIDKMSIDLNNCTHVNDSCQIVSSHTGEDKQKVSIQDTGLVLSPRGRLRQCLPQWKLAGASEYILGVIQEGYRLPFMESSPEVSLKNNKSALDHSDFVREEIGQLLLKGCISEVEDRPAVVNPITVSCNKGKKRMVLDCRHINPYLCKFKCKYEGSSVAREIFIQGNYLFTFDLKSAYHHIEIHPKHRTFLGFSFQFGGEIKYFVYNVLAFGLSTAGYIFTKVTRIMVKFWREQGKKVVMFLDDGIGGENSYQESKQVSTQIKSDLSFFGFLSAEEKCDWEPKLEITWLGEIWNTELNLIKVTVVRINKLMDTLDALVTKVSNGEVLICARYVASLVGQIISMQGAMGPVVRLRTRYLYGCVLTRASWDSPVLIDSKAWEEVIFWKENARDLNGSPIEKRDDHNIVVYSDASAQGYGGYVVQKDDGEVIGTWSALEMGKSSTWRELEGVYRVLNSEKESLEGQKVKWYTDNKNIMYIIETGSRKPDLQRIAMKIHNVCRENNINILPVWISRNENKKADELSKTSDCDDWCLTHEAFLELDKLWGPHTIDRFSFDYNCHCQRFNSRWWCPGTEGIDSFRYHWKGENNWCVPPPRNIGDTIKKMAADVANGTIVIPEWKSAYFWPMLFEGGKTKKFVKGCRNLGRFCTIKGKGGNGVFGKPLAFDMLALRIEHF